MWHFRKGEQRGKGPSQRLTWSDGQLVVMDTSPPLLPSGCSVVVELVGMQAASLPTVSGHPPGQAGVRGFARSVAPSRLSPHWARLSDLLLTPETTADC